VLLVALIGAVAAVAVAVWIVTMPVDVASASDRLESRPGNADHGRLVFAAADCGSCHASPGQPDRLRLGGGLAIASPYGTMRVPNISPHPVDGIGRWRTADLVNALLGGVSPARQHYYPVFPYSSYAHLRVDDVVDLMAFLRTLPAVDGRAPSHDLTFPFNIRRLIGLWKILYLDRSTIPDDPARPAAWNRGRYLVDAAAHCAECHSSRNVLGGIKEKTRFAGGRDPTGTGFVPNMTPTGIGRWSEADIARMLTDGRTPDLRTVGSSMAGVVDNTRLLPEEDRAAIAVYVKTLRARPTAPP
jgi:mono/diheme cytochrome c family protein